MDFSNLHVVLLCIIRLMILLFIQNLCSVNTAHIAQWHTLPTMMREAHGSNPGDGDLIQLERAGLPHAHRLCCAAGGMSTTHYHHVMMCGVLHNANYARPLLVSGHTECINRQEVLHRE